MSAEVQQLVRLKPAVQHYDWGKVGAASAVARLASQSSIQDAPYAELWMGTHEKGPSYAALNDESLVLARDFLKADLPFLFKVLSVAKALSIQAHPDMSLAQRLHKERPNVYADPFHKPEMALAVTNFQVMCGFRDPKEISAHLEQFKEFRAVVGEDTAAKFIAITRASDASSEAKKAALTELFTNVMKCTPDILRAQISALLKSLSQHRGAEEETKDNRNLSIVPLIFRLHSQYPGDVGLFAPFFLNCFQLFPGEAIFLGPNEPHAYLSGDCIECMACSDNVVRAGLTPKLRDVDTLCSMLTYRTMYPDIMRGEPIDNFSLKFEPPVIEFLLIRTLLPAQQRASLPVLDSPSIFLIYSGTGELTTGKESHRLEPGSIILATARARVSVLATSDLLIFRCSANVPVQTS